MCGLVGIFSSNMFQRHKDCLGALLYLDTWRGKDSTGVAALRHNADTAILKSTIPGYEFVEGNRLNDHLKLNDFCWIGHNRHGTIGRNIKANAHPFEILDEQGSCILVGAHNGTLKNKHTLKDHNLFGTDSEALFYQIAGSSVEETMPLVEGAWALVWYDHIAEELRFLRNGERSLFYAYEEGKKSIIWASEAWMIKIACSRTGVKLEEDKVYSFIEDSLYKFPVPLKMNDEITHERKEGLVGKQPAGFFRERGVWKDGKWEVAGVGGSHRWDRGPQSETNPEARTAAQRTAQASAVAITAATSQSGTPKEKDGGTLTLRNAPASDQPPKSSDEDDKVTPISKSKRFKGYSGKLITKKQLQTDLDNGCGWCQTEHLTVGDKYGWLAPNVPLCNKCLKGEPDQKQEAPKSGKAVTVH